MILLQQGVMGNDCGERDFQYSGHKVMSFMQRHAVYRG